MLTYWRGGREVRCEGLYHRGHLGEIVLLDHVSFGKGHQLAEYELPAAFVITKVYDDKEGNAWGIHYQMRDVTGNLVEVDASTSGYFFSAEAWVKWYRDSHKEHMDRQNGYITTLTLRAKLLVGILAGQNLHGENPRAIPSLADSLVRAFSLDITKGTGLKYHIIGRDHEWQEILERHQREPEKLYTADEWVKSQKREAQLEQEAIRSFIKKFESHLDFLKSILVEQGTRILTSEEARSLGLIK